MKKILLIAMIGLTSISYADNQYTMIEDINNSKGGVWILDNKTKKLAYCFADGDRIRCTYPPRDLEMLFKDKW